jgi:hypothetical protein
VDKGAIIFLGGAPSILTAAATLSISSNFITAIPAIECPITNGFSGKVSMSFTIAFTISIFSWET